MHGKIVKGISGFYYVYAAGTGIYECKAKGIFRSRNIKPLVGDNVEIAVISEEEKTGNVEAVLPRKNELLRPAVANIDFALIIFAAASPQPNFQLLDRMLCRMRAERVPAVICFNKCELISESEQEKLRDIYAPAGYEVLFISVKEQRNLESVRRLLCGKTAAAAGPSGVGKSSLINSLQDSVYMETGGISAKIERGKHTTRHAEIIPVEKDTYIMDTPGFSSLEIPDMEKEELWKLFPEFLSYEKNCRFQGCSHLSEPGCGVKEALAKGEISHSRYKSYQFFYEELKNRRRY